MASYRLQSWPEPPPELYQNRSRAVRILVIALICFAGCSWLFFHLHAISVISPPPVLAIVLLIVILWAALLSVLFSALYLRALPRRLGEVGLQSWELSPSGLTHRYPSKADAFVPADALAGFFIRKSSSTTVKTSDGFIGFLLPPSLADREAFQAELRSMRVPERKPPALVSMRGALTLLIVFGFVGFMFSHRPSLVVIGGLGYIAWMTRAQWVMERRRRPDRSPLTSALFYVGTLPWLFFIALQLYGSLHPHRYHVHSSASPHVVQSRVLAIPNTPP